MSLAGYFCESPLTKPLDALGTEDLQARSLFLRHIIAGTSMLTRVDFGDNLDVTLMYMCMRTCNTYIAIYGHGIT